MESIKNVSLSKLINETLDTILARAKIVNNYHIVYNLKLASRKKSDKLYKRQFVALTVQSNNANCFWL